MGIPYVFVAKATAVAVFDGYRRLVRTEAHKVGEKILLRPLPDHNEDSCGDDVPAIVLRQRGKRAIVGPVPPPPPI
jgi:hypothetical protein